VADVVLGIETSCDETSAAVLVGEQARRAPELASLVILSQDVHRVFGGVVPELASRAHLAALPAVVDRALAEAGIGWSAVDAVAVTQGPGLVGALLVGVVYAKALAYARARDLIGVHHMEGHLFAPALEDPELAPPFVALLVSGGHTLLLDVPGWGRYRLLGATRDDAAGEAFDKVSTLLGLGYPGGPAIERLAGEGDPARYAFPRPMLDDGFEFSFSGLKTAVVRYVRSERARGEETPLEDLAASFQEAVVEVQVQKTITGAVDKGVRTVVLGGGVVANTRLRSLMAEHARARGLELLIPPPELCTDNGAMIACAGFYRLQRGERTDLGVGANPGLSL